MSDSTFNDDSQVDQRLDALLTRTLGRVTLPRQQRQRHLERLGITPRLGGSASMWRAPVVAGRPPTSTTPTPESLPARRRRRQWLELGAAVIAVILVGALLVAVFRDWSGGEDEQQLAASPEATNAPATATPRETREQLYVVSHAVRQGQDVALTEGRVSAIDPETGEEYWSVEAGPRIDSVLSPDRQRLFVADSQREGDFIYAFDTRTGRELWRQPIENRQWMKPATGQSMLSISPDGATLSVYTCEGCTGEFRSNTGRNWLAQFNAATGDRLDDLEITACRGTTILGPETAAARPIYVICDMSSRLEIVDLATGQPRTLAYDERLDGGFPETTGINASVVSPDGRLLYLASGNRLTVVDMTRHAARRVQLAEEVNVERRLPLLALSPDGERLYIGSLDTAAYDRGRAEVNRVDVYNTSSWEPLGQIATSYPLNGQAFNTASAGDTVYGTYVSYPGTDDTAVESLILRHTLDSEPQTVATRSNEEVLFLFAGTVEVEPDAEPLPTPTPEPVSHSRLFAVSNILSTDRNVVGGRVTAYDAETGEIVYWIDTGTNPDAVLSPDGTRLYIAANSEDGDTVSSYDAVSGDRNWSVPIEHRHMWQFGEGPTGLAVSQDGSRLFVYSASAPGDYFIQVFDTSDGRLGRVIDGVAGCTAQLFPSADGRTLYVVCIAERFPPQVIDLEAWTSAGVMQGFGGVISGAAASSDGRWLYIPQDFDGEMSLSVIDMNGRVVADMRSIIHLDRDPLHSLNMTAISPDGSRLFIGVGSEPENGSPVADEVWAWDTAMLHVDLPREILREPITGWSLAPAPDNRSVFAIRNEPIDATILRITVEGDGETEAFTSRPDWRLLRLFSGRVYRSDVPPMPPTASAGLIEELTIPTDLPLGLKLTSASSGSDFAELTFTGDDARVVQIDVERWDGEPLDPPVRSTSIHLGNLSAYVIPDPEGGWPRGVYWRDSRFVYSLSVLSSPSTGWTQDNAIAVMLAFSSPADASVCPTTPWADLSGRDPNLLPEAYWIDGDGLALGHLDGRLVVGKNALAWVVDSPGIVDPDPSARVVMRATRLGTGEQRPVPLELRDYAIEYNAVIDGGVEHHIDSTFVFPAAGCWQIEAGFGGQTVQAIVHVAPHDASGDPLAIWDTLRWRPLHETGIDASPPCVRTPAQQVFADFGPVIGDMQANGGPVYLNGTDENGAINILGGITVEGGYYARVLIITSGDYTGPLLVRPSPGSGSIGFSQDVPDVAPASEWQLTDPALTTQTVGVRHWGVYLRFDAPGCHALQIDGLDFTSIILFEVLVDGGS